MYSCFLDFPVFFRRKTYFCSTSNHRTMYKKLIPVIAFSVLLLSCSDGKQKATEKTSSKFTGARAEVKLMTLDPGHFHAALIQKSMYEQIDPTVYVYAPEGDDVSQHLGRIEAFNKRADKPTVWVEKVYTGADYLEKMLTEKPGNVMMVAGNNAKKTEYIQKAVEAGINVFADKPMVITPEAFPVLEQAFKKAEEKGVLIYDIMTERFEITNIVQKELVNTPEVFGSLVEGSPNEPAIEIKSVHNFCKMVSGSALKRPAWFFDISQQGEANADVATHLVDLAQWSAFPEQILNKADVQMLSATRWTTDFTPGQFEKVTGLKEFPEFLKKDVSDGKLKVYANGEMQYKLKNKLFKVVSIWDYQAPEGAGDTHYSLMRGTQCNVIIKQTKDEKYKPTVYVEATGATDLAAFEASLRKAVEESISAKYAGLKLTKLGDKKWVIEIPASYSVGHEAHFGQVTEKYLQYLKDGKLPAWEVPNMLVKYYITTEALKLTRNNSDMKLKINRLQHIGIPVTNILVSKAFYERLGFEQATSSGFMHHGMEGKMMMMKLNDIVIELYQLPEPDLGQIRSRKDGHIDHITFDVDDIDETFLALKAESFSIIEEAPVFLPFWKNGCKYFNILGPDGERLEFNQIL